MACLPLTVAGGVAQAGGFALTLWELSRTQRREFPERVPIHHKVSRWVRCKLGTTHAQQLAAELRAEAKLRASLDFEIDRGEATTMEGRVSRLETVVGDLRRKQREDRGKLEDRIEEVLRETTTSHQGLRAELAEAEAQRKANLSDSLLYQRIGVGMFLSGVLLSVLGSLA
jgi:hypothetical protein